MNFIKRLFSSYNKNISFEKLNFFAFENSPMATLVLNEKGIILGVNNTFSQLTGYTDSDAVGQNMSLMKSLKYDDIFYKDFWEKIFKSMEYNHELLNRCKDNTILLMRERIKRISEDSKTYFVVTLEDITEDKKQFERHYYLAMHDSLTGLANRTLLRERFAKAKIDALRDGNKMGILVCDLNGLKHINDTLGHGVGDIAIKEIADRLMYLVRNNDTVARYGGDEFVIILDQIEEDSELYSRVEDIKSSFPITLKNENNCLLNISVGHANFPTEGTDLDQLVKVADKKLYEDKKRFYGIFRK